MADIAGLVLGAIPLVIAAIEHYQTCFEALRCWQEFQDEHRKCIRRILHFEVQFEFLLVRLFGNHVEGRTELDLLKAGYRSKSWDDVELILEVRLGRAVYRLFCETLRDVCKAVEGLKTVLQIDDKTLLD
ncbi:uncharacterized protein K489DRAFT_290099, partial [Dissoconium aciculare CBS 342.82]|uniref:Prion-inhibition and propagation HeLo domain-containing protein n=1 Tax=Dissoconium aciculare CBS 342.82 TaxID=1314786 RepID=A0A6J3LWJ4_9PEZI